MDTTNQKIAQATKLSKLQEESITQHQGVIEEKITHNKKIRYEMKRREQVQTQELLVGLTNELFEKVKKLSEKEKSNAKKITKEKSKSQKKNTEKDSKIVFTDLTWYREKLAASEGKNH
jgi:hypothetical protein